LGEVAVAAGDVLEHRGHAVDRAGYAGGGQPDQQQTQEPGGSAHQQGLEGAGRLGFVEDLLQFYGVGQHHVFGQFNHHPPGFGIGDRLDCVDRTNRIALLKIDVAVIGQQLHDLIALGAQRIDQIFADPRRLAAVGGNQTGAGDNLQVRGAIEQRLLGRISQGLQAVERNVHTHHTNHFSIHQQRLGNGGHQYRFAGHSVFVRIQETGAAGVTRAGVPDVVGCAV